MPATATIKTRSIQGESLTAAADRLINTVLLREGVVDKANDSFKVAQDTGANMQVKVGSGSAYDLAVVEGDNAGQGTFVLEHQSATVTLPVAAADATNDRIDIVVLRVYDDTFDSSGNDYADIEVIQGTPAGSPSAPATPDSAIKLAEIEVGNGVTAITNADITDSREEYKKRGELVETLYYTSPGTFDKADYPWLDHVVVQVAGGGGAGGGVGSTGSGQTATGGGGGSGGYSKKRIAVSDLSASETVTVGAAGTGASAGTGGSGGNSSFGAHCSADGGTGGGAQSGGTGIDITTMGTGGAATGGDINIAGGSGGRAVRLTTYPGRVQTGYGAPHMLGTPGRQGNGGDGLAAAGYGAGGGGADRIQNSAAATGGDGAPGIVIVELYA